VFEVAVLPSPPSEVGHREVAQHCLARELIEEVHGPSDRRFLVASEPAVAAGDRRTPERAEDPARDHPAAEAQPARQHVGGQSADRSRHDRAGDRATTFVEAGRTRHLEVLHALLDRGRALAFEAMGLDHPTHQLGGAFVQAGIQRGHRPLLVDRAELERPRQPLQRTGVLATPGRCLTVRRRPREITADGFAAAAERREVALVPRHRQRVKRIPLASLQQRRHALEQHAFLGPAAGKGVQRQHAPDHRPRGGEATPLVLQPLCVAAGLVEQQQHRAVHPGQQFQLQRNVPGRGRLLGCVDQVKNDIRFFLDVSYGLLAAPQRTVGHPIPDLVQEPAERVALVTQAQHQSTSVTETRCVPQPQPGLGRFDQRVGLADFRDVSLVAYLADVASQESSRQGRLPDVRVGDQAQRDGRHAPASDDRQIAAPRASRASLSTEGCESSSSSARSASRTTRCQLRKRSFHRLASATRSR